MSIHIKFEHNYKFYSVNYLFWFLVKHYNQMAAILKLSPFLGLGVGKV